ncbi:zinc finger protein 829-like [Physella acuta]|uniref:zinc finger protein 829-like n=1 Tax=Physella acuta TaxID=109671 RepID=UPI0027DE2A67|nr:zinc finger protein 829-like [Physella acuta]
MVRHQELIHPEEKSYKCDVCSRSFPNICFLKRHQRRHTQRKIYKCDQCDQCFSSHFNFTKHQRTHTAKTLMCDKCGELFTKVDDMKEHHLRVHSKEKWDEKGVIAKNSKLEVEKKRSEAMPESLSASGNLDSELTPAVEATPQDVVPANVVQLHSPNFPFWRVL